jgi:hypothetical protein
LLDFGLTPEMNELGLDVLDLLLEDSYEYGRLNRSLNLIVSEIEMIEPSHHSRVARIKKYFPEEYKKLVQLNSKFMVESEIEVNQFRLKMY